MTRILKLSAMMIGIFILLAVLGLGLLVAFVSPNKFKPIITAQVLKYTGRQLTIDGDLSWSFFPSLGVKVGHAVLNNPAQFKETTFAEIDHATVGVKVLPLLHAKIETTGISLAGVKLNLIKNADGQANWQNLLLPKQAADIAATQDEAQPTSNKNVTMNIEIPSVDINDAQVKWTDEKSKQSADIDHFEFHAKNISLDHAFPVSMSLRFAAKNPTAAGQLKFDGQVKLDLNQQLYQILDMDASLHLQQNNVNVPITLKGDVIADLTKQTVKINDMKATLANAVLDGNLDVTHLNSNPVVLVRAQSQPFDLKKLLQSLGQDVAALQAAKEVVADVKVSLDTAEKNNANASAPFAALHGVKMQGHLKMGEVQAAKLKMTNVVIDTQLNNNVVQVTPLSASLYQGDLQGQAKVNLTTTVPQFALNAKLANVQSEPLLQDLGSQGAKIKVKGAGNIALQVTTAGMASDAVLQNLNGTAQFSFKDGQVEGINIGNLIDSAYALIKHNPMPADHENVTNFGTLTGTAVIQNGVISNKDLLMDSPRFNTTGQGTIDLVKQQLNYQLQIMPKHKDQTLMDGLGTGIPVRIAGSFNSPSIGLDTQAIIAAVAKQQVHQVQNKVKEQIQNKIKEQLPGQAGALIQNLLGN
jgi:AsmA protein